MPPPSERRRHWLKAALAAGAALPFQAARAQSEPAGGRDTIRLGQSVPLSGPAQHLGIEYQRGLHLAIQAANAAGGVRGQRLELISYDDRYEPEAALANTQDLLGGDKVFALVGYVGTDAVNRCLPLAEKAGVPMLAPLTGAESLRRNPSRWLWHLRPGLSAETTLIARSLRTIGFSRVAVLQQDDADGQAGMEALQHALAAAGLPPAVALARVARNSTNQVEWKSRDIQAAARTLMSGQPMAVVFLAAYASTAAVMLALRDGGFAGGCFATSLSSAAAIGPLLGAKAGGLSVTQVMPSPFDSSRPVVATYQRLLQASHGPAPEYVSLEGWVAGMAIVEGLRRMPRGGNRAAFMQAMESLAGWDAGGLVLRWDAQRRQAISDVAMTVLDREGRPIR